MRRVITALLAPAILATAFLGATTVSAQSQDEELIRRVEEQQRQTRPGRLRGRANAGPCPYVKILYDAARYVEMSGEVASASAVGFTGEIEGLSANCQYRGDEPITVDMDILFQLGRGPQAGGDQHTYRYWIAVTERNSAVLAKEYFDLGVNFGGSDRISVTEEIRGLTIPRADHTISGANFEILIGFEVTPEMAEFNRTGSRFRINAGQTGAAAE